MKTFCEPNRSAVVNKRVELSNIYKAALSTSHHGKYEKLLKYILVTPNSEDEDSIFIEWRLYKDEKEKENVIFMTSREYDWMIENISMVKEYNIALNFTYNNKSALGTKELVFISLQK